MGQPLELEILFLNLIRNASAALRTAQEKSALTEEPAVFVRLSAGSDAPSANWHITVQNPGEVLSDDAFKRFTEKSASVTSSPSSYGGLGLGLTICRGIADRHGASLVFERRTEGGVTALVTIDAALPQEQHLKKHSDDGEKT